VAIVKKFFSIFRRKNTSGVVVGNNEAYDSLRLMSSNATSNFDFGEISQQKAAWFGHSSHFAKLFSNISLIKDNDCNPEKFNRLIFWGIRGIGRFPKIRECPNKAVIAEDGFIRSILSGVAKGSQKKFSKACSVIFDDLAPHFAGEFVTRIEQKLNSDFSLSESELLRSKAAIDKIVRNNITKYNFQKLDEIKLPGNKTKKVLIIDQTAMDASITYSNLTADSYSTMLLDAIKENPDSDIIIKTHPDSILSNRSDLAGFFNADNTNYPNVYLYAQTVNPIILINMVDRVYVGSSGVGMEAILCKKEVFCYGVPFYAGWGLTVDRNEFFTSNKLQQRRSKKRTKEELFYSFYIWYTHYINPETDSVCEIEQALDFILKCREEFLVEG